MRIRQVALVARELEPTVASLCDVLGLEICYRDPGVGTFGLENALMAVGDTFLEVVSPREPETSAGRWLDRRGGDGGYMVIVQTPDLARDRKRLVELGVRVVWEIALDDIASVHLHPRDVGAALVSIDEAHPAESWRWAGPEWRTKLRIERVTGIAGVELQSPRPDALAQRWCEVLDQPLASSGEMPLEDGRLRFAAPRDDRGEGIAGLELVCRDGEAVRAAARERGFATGDDWVELAGVRFWLRQG
ncbi:MAG: VOC family protein [Proteobacteria bacterium]|nr:VOC family protein [Pseudomonadota bacterium]